MPGPYRCPRLVPGAIFSLLLFCCHPSARAHDAITTKLTWTREISRIVYARCIACHRPGGTSFSLATYAEARPWAKAIAEEVLERRMPPWGAVKGFGDFRNDQSLSQEQLEWIAHWVDGGAPEGDPKDLAALPKTSRPLPAAAQREIIVSDGFIVDRAIVLDGLLPKTIAAGASAQITAELPGGAIEPLVWLYQYQPRHGHAFLLQTPLELPRGAVIRGIPPESRIALSVVTAAREPVHRNARYSPRPAAGTAPTSDKSAHAEKLN